MMKMERDRLKKLKARQAKEIRQIVETEEKVARIQQENLEKEKRDQARLLEREKAKKAARAEKASNRTLLPWYVSGSSPSVFSSHGLSSTVKGKAVTPSSVLPDPPFVFVFAVHSWGPRYARPSAYGRINKKQVRKPKKT